MKVVILAGGRGTRISEETETIPKPMVEIGGKPVLWHIMKTYSHYGYHDFVLCLGYKGYIIKEYFSHYFLHMTDVTIDMTSNDIKIHSRFSEPWKVTLVDTGLETMTGGRLKRVQNYVENKPFLMTYGDGLADIDLKAAIESHKKSNTLATITAVQPLGRFGSLDINASNKVESFFEKPKGDKVWINAGYFILEPKIFDYIKNGDASVWEKDPLEKLAAEGQLNAFKHQGFWKPMDTLRDKVELENMWKTGKAPWKVW